MSYVMRDEAGKITGQFANAQPEFAEEWVADDSAELSPPSAFHVWKNNKWKLPVAGKKSLLLEAQAAKLTTINTEFDRRSAVVRADVPADEVSSWPKQEQEARALISGAVTPAEVPLLSTLATARGVPLDILAQKVVEKADQHTLYMGQIIGTRQHLEDVLISIDLTSATAAQQIEAIKWPD